MAPVDLFFARSIAICRPIPLEAPTMRAACCWGAIFDVSIVERVVGSWQSSIDHVWSRMLDLSIVKL